MIKRDFDRWLYEVYITETLWNMSRMQTIETRYKDLIAPEPPEETRTAEEIIDHIKKGLGEVS